MGWILIAQAASAPERLEVGIGVREHPAPLVVLQLLDGLPTGGIHITLWVFSGTKMLAIL